MSSTVLSVDHAPLPKSILHVEGDPTEWGLSETDQARPPWITGEDPVELPVVSPLVGTLLLAPKLAGSFLLYPKPPITGGWVPCVRLPSAYLYLPSTVGVPADSPGYMLAPDTDLGQLRRDIKTVMGHDQFLTVDVSIGGVTGVVVLNGTKLPFVVLAEFRALR